MEFRWVYLVGCCYKWHWQNAISLFHIKWTDPSWTVISIPDFTKLHVSFQQAQAIHTAPCKKNLTVWINSLVSTLISINLKYPNLLWLYEWWRFNSVGWNIYRIPHSDDSQCAVKYVVECISPLYHTIAYDENEFNILPSFSSTKFYVYPAKTLQFDYIAAWLSQCIC